MNIPSNLDTEPFCSKGCKDVYVHVVQCTSSDYPAVDPDKYSTLDNERLIDEYDNLHADYHRYSQPPISWDSKYRDYHKPTVNEAGRRMGLVKEELLRRMSSR